MINFLSLICQLPVDGGPMYAETDLSRFIAEPWNTWSSLALVFPAIYWAVRLRANFKHFGFIYASIPFLMVGGIGSLLYHASRNFPLLLYLDVVPTAILTIMVGCYFWWKVLKKWFLVLLIIFPFVLLRIYLLLYHSGQFAINLSYFIAGLAIFLPVIIYVLRHNFRHVAPFSISVACLTISLVLRETDEYLQYILPMGSHFLWHIISGIGAFYLAKSLYLIRLDEINAP